MAGFEQHMLHLAQMKRLHEARGLVEVESDAESSSSSDDSYDDDDDAGGNDCAIKTGCQHISLETLIVSQILSLPSCPCAR